jgi:hypothetical protein
VEINREFASGLALLTILSVFLIQFIPVLHLHLLSPQAVRQVSSGAVGNPQAALPYAQG